MRQFQLNITTKKICFFMVDSTDHVTPETGLTLTVRVSKNGGAFAAGGGSVSELETGLYAYTVGAGDVDTLGAAVFTATASGADMAVIEVLIVAYNPYDAVRLGVTSLPNAAADAAGGLPISDAGGLDLDAKLANTNEVTAARMAALTDLINGGRLDLLIDAIKDKTDNLPASPAAVGSAMTLTAAYDAAKTAATQTAVEAIYAIVNSVTIGNSAIKTALANMAIVDICARFFGGKKVVRNDTNKTIKIYDEAGTTLLHTFTQVTVGDDVTRTRIDE